MSLLKGYLSGLVSAREQSFPPDGRSAEGPRGAKTRAFHRWELACRGASAGEARIFHTSLGQVDNLKDPSFVRMPANAVHWALRKDAPQVVGGHS